MQFEMVALSTLSSPNYGNIMMKFYSQVHIIVCSYYFMKNSKNQFSVLSSKIQNEKLFSYFLFIEEWKIIARYLQGLVYKLREIGQKIEKIM